VGKDGHLDSCFCRNDMFYVVGVNMDSWSLIGVKDRLFGNSSGYYDVHYEE